MANDNEAKIVLSAEDRFSRTFSSLKRDLAAAGQEIQGLTRLASGLGSAFGVGAIGLGAGAALLATQLKNAVESLDELNDVSDAVGDSVENLSALEDVARRNGEGIDLVTTSLVKLNKTLAEAKADSPISIALKEIGLDATALRAANPSEALREVAVALQGYANNGNKARIVRELFGNSLRDVAPFLKDLAETGRLNATATAEQAAAAKKLREEWFGLTTDIGNVSREIAGNLLPRILETIATFRQAASDGRGFFSTLRTEQLKLLGLGGDQTDYNARIAALNKLLESGTLTQERRARIEKQLADLRGRQTADLFGGFAKTAGSFGGGKVELPSLPDLTDSNAKAEKARTSEAQRYLETLQKQGDKLEDLTALQQVQRDIEAGRIEGLTPLLAEQIRQEAARIDLQKDINEGKEREIGFQKLLVEGEQRQLRAVEERQAALDKFIADLAAGGRNSALQLVADTDLARLEKAQVQLENLRALLNEPAFQTPDAANQVIEAIERIQSAMAELGQKGKSEFEKLADTIEKTMDRSTDAIIDFVVDGQTSTESLWKTFSRDILRQLVEDPVRDVMKSVAATIKSTLGDLQNGGGGGNPLASIFSSLGSSGGGGGGFDWTAFLTQIFASSATGFANGGRVRGGSLLRVNENGTETFIPGQDGVILNASQTRARAGQGQAMAITNVFNVNGDVSDRTVQMLDAMIQRNNAKLQRSMRTGGGWAPA